MLVAYSDESGVGDCKEPVTVVTAVVINMDTQWNAVEGQLFSAIDNTPRYLMQRKPKKHPALKGKLFYQALRKGDLEADKALTEIMNILPACGLPVFYGAIDRAGYKRFLNTRQPDHALPEYAAAFSECLKRVDRASRAFTKNDRVLWIADQSDRQREPATGSRLFWHRVFTEVAVGTSKPTGVSSSLVDTVHFGSSDVSVALQLADVCCSTVTNHLLDTYYEQRSLLAAKFYEQIRCNVLNDGTPPLYMELIERPEGAQK